MPHARGLLSTVHLLPLLLPGAVANTVVRVRTGPDLQRIVNAGAAHVLVVEHLELRGLADGEPCGDVVCVNDMSHAGVERVSIRGECFGEVPFASNVTAALPTLQPQQCVILVDKDWLHVENKHLWIHNLHVFAPTRVEPTIRLETVSSARVWNTFVGLQSDGGESQLIYVMSDSGYCLFADGYMANSTHPREAAAVRTRGTTTVFNTTVVHAFVLDDLLRGAFNAEGSASDGGGRLSVYNVTLDELSQPLLSRTTNGTVYSDTEEVWDMDARMFGSSLPLDAVPAGEFLTPGDDELLAIQQEALSFRVVNEGSTSTAIVVPTVIAATVAIVAVLGVVVYRRRRRRSGSSTNLLSLRTPQSTLASGKRSRPDGLLTHEDSDDQGTVSQSAMTRGGSANASEAPASRMGTEPSTTHVSRAGGLDGPSDLLPALPSLVPGVSAPVHPPQAPMVQPLGVTHGANTYTNTLVVSTATYDPSFVPTPLSPRTRMELALDHVFAQNALVFEKFRMPGGGPRHRRRGGQALVQFLEDAHTRAMLAAKFFVNERHFRRERELYEVDALRAAMPTLVDVYAAGWMPRDSADGAPLPPCLVMDRGESMTEYIEAAGHNLFTAVQALGHIANKLGALHAEGWVHRDLKPPNLLWIPNKRTWSLLDFGCAARSGSRARLAYTLAYVAPEVLQAEEDGEHEVVVHPALDMWSLGIIAVEMLTEKPVFPVIAMKQNVVNAVLGRASLPWEDEELAKPLLKKLGSFRKCVLACLERDPTKRIDCQSFLNSWTEVFSEGS